MLKSDRLIGTPAGNQSEDGLHLLNDVQLRCPHGHWGRIRG